jgi:hypothetical protein
VRLDRAEAEASLARHRATGPWGIYSGPGYGRSSRLAHENITALLEDSVAALLAAIERRREERRQKKPPQ